MLRWNDLALSYLTVWWFCWRYFKRPFLIPNWQFSQAFCMLQITCLSSTYSLETVPLPGADSLYSPALFIRSRVFRGGSEGKEQKMKASSGSGHCARQLSTVITSNTHNEFKIASPHPAYIFECLQHKHFIGVFKARDSLLITSSWRIMETLPFFLAAFLALCWMPSGK